MLLEGKYEVRFGDKPVGGVQVEKQGLYYRFSCRCRLSGAVVCRLMAQWDTGSESLGILVPMGEEFGLDRAVAAKKCGVGRPSFLVVPNRETQSGRFIPISPEEPFAYIQRLKDAYFERRYGQAGIVLREG